MVDDTSAFRQCCDIMQVMKIILVISDTQRKNLVFVTDALTVFSLPEAIKAVQNGKIQSVHTVKTGAGTYLRASTNATDQDNVDFIAHSSYQLYDAIKDSKLSQKNVGKVSRSYLYQYVAQPKHSIFFAAATIRSFVKEWAYKIDLSKRPEILAALYHLPYREPKENPGSNDRGMQIIEEFYPLAKGILFR